MTHISEVKRSSVEGWWDIRICFPDGEKEHGGQTYEHDRMYGFSVQALNETDARMIVRSHLLSMVEVLNRELNIETIVRPGQVL